MGANVTPTPFQKVVTLLEQLEETFNWSVMKAIGASIPASEESLWELSNAELARYLKQRLKQSGRGRSPNAPRR